MKRILTVGLLLMTLGGCATVPMASNEQDAEAKEFQLPPEGKSGLYVFRDSFVGKALKKTIRVDGEVIGESAPDVFFYKVIDSGEHVLSTESEFSPNDLIINTEPKKNYFVENYIKMGVFVGGAGLKEVSEQEGMERVKKLKLAQ
ncbi:DUF2846 domain-containing protein [Vibrio sp. CAU 1672]|uniref:DUF2846 domain-containing protein n=1 Tax=Vibrio sp. CAU 1672 TaxID=3032594 RepID=UPI0023DBC947|nr:DUF2846 domain-containing protein [Vibrio sp. CAU 1672]MDF2155028.1 DUF2846 domain-containing protein [Vibrio sp. CAU 1672]